MRRVAAALDTGPASLYVYVLNREDLLQAMLDRVTGTVELESPDPARWRGQLHALLQRLRHALVAHPGIAAITLSRSPTTEAVLRLTENLLGLLLGGGLDPQETARACDILVLLVTAAAREDGVRHTDSGADDDHPHQRVRDLHATFAGLPPQRYPLISTHADHLVAGDSTERFHYAIDVVLGGLLARTTRP